MGKKSKKKRQENQTRSVGDLADNVSRTIPENVEAAASGDISTFFDEFPDFVNDMQSALVEVFGEQLVSDNRVTFRELLRNTLCQVVVGYLVTHSIQQCQRIFTLGVSTREALSMLILPIN